MRTPIVISVELLDQGLVLLILFKRLALPSIHVHDHTLEEILQVKAIVTFNDACGFHEGFQGLQVLPSLMLQEGLRHIYLQLLWHQLQPCLRLR